MLEKLKRTNFFNIPFGKYLYVNIWVFPIFFSSVFKGYYIIYIVSYITALLHELSHILSAKLLKIKTSKVEIYPFGICARLSDSYIASSEKEFLVAFAGPFSNLILFWLCSFISIFFQSEILEYCINLNLAMCVLNLIPALPLDGGRILKAILTSKYGILRAYNFMVKLSRLLICVILIAALIIFFVYDFNFSLILISVFLLQNICAEQKTISLITLKEIIKRKDNKIISGEKSAKTICVNKNAPARTILKHLSYDYVFVIHIVDDFGKIIKTVTEIQVLSKLTEKGIRIKYIDV